MFPGRLLRHRSMRLPSCGYFFLQSIQEGTLPGLWVTWVLLGLLSLAGYPYLPGRESVKTLVILSWNLAQLQGFPFIIRTEYQSSVPPLMGFLAS
jgi:hypothetical protein